MKQRVVSQSVGCFVVNTFVYDTTTSQSVEKDTNESKDLNKSCEVCMEKVRVIRQKNDFFFQ